MAPSRLLALPLSLLATLGTGCGGDPSPAPGPLTPFGERPFPELGPSDFEVTPGAGFPLAKRHLVIAFRPTTAEAEASRVIASTGGTLVGALGAAKVVLVQLPASVTSEARLTIVDRVEREAAVAGVTEDMIVGTAVAPQRNANFAQWDWDSPGASAGNHALRSMGMPVAWNLNPVVQPAAMQRRVRVGVIDGAIQRHSDLVPDVMTIVGDATPDNGGHHGTSVAGIIGARWDGRGTDGVSPFVAITATLAAPVDTSNWDALYNSPETVPVAYARSLSQTWQVLRSARPRVVNISLGFNHYDTCHANGLLGAERRCDPRQGSTQWGPAVADSNCDGALVRRRIGQSGQIFGAMVDAAQASGPTLFVVAAGNDSGSNRGDTVCPRAEHPNVPLGMGLFPAEFASPYANAGTAQRNANVLVVEVVRPNEDMRGELHRASYSNVGGNILAPGDGVQSPSGGGSASSVAGFNGTSSASPHAAGAAAFLLALDPRLSNATLRELLTAQQGAVADTPTRARVYLPAALARMSVVLARMDGADAPASRLLADMDDGTAHGMSVSTFDVYGRVTGRSMSRHDATRPPAVDMADFRYFRNSALLYANERTVECPREVPACDLNLDGRWAYGAQAERHPRAEIAQLPIGEANLAAAANLEAFTAQFQGDPAQGWRREELAGLLRSADLEFFPGEFLARTGATSVRVTVSGEASGPGAPARREPVTDVNVGGAPLVMTVPFGGSLGVRVAVVGGRYDGRVLMSSREVSVGPGAHLPLFLNPCAFEEMESRRRDVLDPYTPDCSETDAGVPDAGMTDAGMPDAGADTCADLERGTAPYVRFSVTGGSLPASYIGCYGHVAPATFRAYFNSRTGRSLFRMTGRAMVNGQPEDVNLEFHTAGSAPVAERWPADIAPNPMRLTFSAPPIGSGTTLREFSSPDGVSSGTTTITRYGAVGTMIEGSFNGTGILWQTQPSSQRFDGATITGSFRVPRAPDP